MIDSIEKLKMKPEQAVRWLGLGIKIIRLRLQKGYPLGVMLCIGKSWSYNISTAKLFDTLGIPYKVDTKEETL